MYLFCLFILLFCLGCNREEYPNYNPLISTDCSFIDSTGTCCNDSDKDCNNICFGNSKYDCDGICNGIGIEDTNGNCCPTGSYDDDGDCCDGTIDACGVCNGIGYFTCWDDSQVCNLNQCSGCNIESSPNYQESSTSSDNCIYDEDYDGWNVVWNDEFENEELNLNKWSHHIGTGSEFGLDGWGNEEEQYYTDLPENIRIENGILIIQALHKNYSDSEYTSARIYSDNDWTYGRVDIKAKLPSGKGTWPAFWMLPHDNTDDWPSGGEIDIMEHVGCSEGTIHGSIHCTDHNHTNGTQETETTYISNIDDFNIYRLIWDEESIKCYIDDDGSIDNEQPFFEYFNDGEGSNSSWPFDKSFYLILNLAVGGTFGGVCEFDSGEVDEQKIEIEYVRILNNN